MYTSWRSVTFIWREVMSGLLHIERSAFNSGLCDRGIDSRQGNCSLYVYHHIHNGSGTHLASYPMRFEVSSCGSKPIGAWKLIDAGIENLYIYPHASRTYLWLGAYTPHEMHAYWYFYLKNKPLEELTSQLLFKCFRIHTEANSKTLSRVKETRHGVWVDNWIYWTLTTRNDK
jgi:hypothetical protein